MLAIPPGDNETRIKLSAKLREKLEALYARDKVLDFDGESLIIRDGTSCTLCGRGDDEYLRYYGKPICWHCVEEILLHMISSTKHLLRSVEDAPAFQPRVVVDILPVGEDNNGVH